MTAELQLKGIAEGDIDDNDILLGRGGKTNHHPGNASYLKLIEQRQVEYMFLESRTEKTEYAMDFVQKLRKEGTRFLKKDDKDGKKWSDVGDVKMREKVSQNLREHQPKLKKQLAEQQRLEQVHQMTPPQASVLALPPLTQQTSGQQQFVDHQQLLQQQQFLQMQAMAQQNQLQSQQHFQLLAQQQQSQFPNYPNQMMTNNVMGNMGMQAAVGSMMTPNGMNNGIDNLPFNEISTPGQQWNNNNTDPYDPRISALSIPETIQSSLEPDAFANNDGMPLQNIVKPSLGARIATLTDVDVAVAMGESTKSLLDSLNIDQVPEEAEANNNDPLLSPKPSSHTINGTDQVTPVLHNRRVLARPPYGDIATVTPTPNSPKQKAVAGFSVLDNDMLQAWASTAEEEDSFGAAIGGAPFRRSSADEASAPPPRPTAAPFQRNNTAPVPTPASDRPSAITKDKRATSNINETQETRQHLLFQEQGMGDAFASSYEGLPARDSSSFSSVKKASLGRDKSAQSRLLKQQCMPYAYGPATGSFSTVSTTSSTNTSGSFNANGWATNLSPVPDNNSPTPPNEEDGLTREETLPTVNTNSPVPNTNNGLTREVTPRTYAVLQDFGKMTLSQAVAKGLSPSRARTAATFEDILVSRDPAADARQLAMDLMVKKPSPLMSNNRTSTIEALDLDSLEDDTVLKEERGEPAAGEEGRPSLRSSFGSAAGMWASMPTSEEFEALVSDAAGPPSLVLPNLKAS